MADISWIKLSTGLPDNKKIKRIRKLPDGDKVILFWVFLLARAGESNQSGGLFLTETLPYQEEDLAADFDFSIEFVHFALITLEKYSMITRYDEILFIKNWEEYQAIEGMEKIREQNRLRKQKQREREKQLLAPDSVSRDSHKEVTASHATEEEVEKNKNKSKKEEIEEDTNSDILLSDYFNTFTNLAIKNNKLREAVKIEFIKLPMFQKEQAVIGAKNYSVWYKREKNDDPTGKFSVNAVKFIIGDKETFDDFQTLPISNPQNRKAGGYI
ncbi:MAG: phage replisome organizer protein [Lactococcus lactis]